jgi:hypothetical protein
VCTVTRKKDTDTIPKLERNPTNSEQPWSADAPWQ